MKIIIDINHPAHVHYFRNFYRIITDKGHEVLFVSRNKEITHQLLDLYKIPYVKRGRGSDGKIGKFLYMLYADWLLFKLSIKFKPNLFLNFLHPYPSQVARLLGKPSFVFSDTEHASLHHKLTLPFATKVFTPACYRTNLGSKQVKFNSYMELSYLHPNYYQPNANILQLLGIEENERYVIVRFVSWAAAHDYGHTGMSLDNKKKAIAEISKYARVFITSEATLPKDLETYRIRIPFNRMHDAIYYSDLLLGESATMASEAAMLGTPAIYLDNDGRGYTDDLEKKYGLVFNFTESESDQLLAIKKAVELLSDNESKTKATNSRNRLLEECIDTTQFMVDTVLGTPLT